MMYTKLSPKLKIVVDRYKQAVSKHAADKRIKGLLDTLIDEAVMPYMKYYPPAPLDRGENPRYIRDIGLFYRYASKNMNRNVMQTFDVRVPVKQTKGYRYERVSLSGKVLRPSEQMHSQWKIKETISGYIVSNNASYSGLMYYASRQPSFHRKRKWPNNVGLMKRIRERLNTLMMKRGVMTYIGFGGD